MVLGDGQAQAESNWVDQWHNFSNICGDQADQPALIKIFAKHYQGWYLPVADPGFPGGGGILPKTA